VHPAANLETVGMIKVSAAAGIQTPTHSCPAHSLVTALPKLDQIPT